MGELFLLPSSDWGIIRDELLDLRVINGCLANPVAESDNRVNSMATLDGAEARTLDQGSHEADDGEAAAKPNPTLTPAQQLREQR